MTHLTSNDNLITVIKIKQNKDKYLVSLSNNEELLVPDFLMVEYIITSNKHFTNIEYIELKKDIKLYNIFNKTLRKLNYKLRTKNEIINYLIKENLNSTDIDRIINKLTNLNYINDERYAKVFKEECISKKLGKKYIFHKLKSVGIDNDIINNILDTYNEEILLDELIVIYQKKASTYSSYPINIQKQKLTNLLINKGFNSTTINKVINNIEFIENIENRLLKDIKKIKALTSDSNKQIKYLLQKGYTYNQIKELI